MKHLFLAAGFLALTSTASVFACTQAPASMMQQLHVKRVLESSSFTQELNELLKKDYSILMTSVQFEKGVVVTFSNGCLIHSNVLYNPPSSNGMCPSFAGVESTTICPE